MKDSRSPARQALQSFGHVQIAHHGRDALELESCTFFGA